jgi:hypothetical protein
LSLTDIKKELKKLDKDKLIHLVADLYKKNKSVREFFDFYVNPNEKDVFDKHRSKIFEAFYPKRGFGYKLKAGKQAISDFKKLGTSSDLLADLMLFYVEIGVKFTNDFGDIDENFYLSLEKTYVQALTLMKKEDLLERFADRTHKIIEDTEGIGWGFHDCLIGVYFDFYSDYIDEKKKEEL